MERPVIPHSRVLSNSASIYQISPRLSRSATDWRRSEIAGSIDGSIDGTTPKVRPAGLEPATDGLENRCSIHLSYGRSMTGAARALDRLTERNASRSRAAPGRIRTCDLRFRKPPLYPPELRARSLPCLDLGAKIGSCQSAVGGVASGGFVAARGSVQAVRRGSG